MAFFRSSADNEEERTKGRAGSGRGTFNGERGEREGETDEGDIPAEESEPCEYDDDDDDEPDMGGRIHLRFSRLWW